MYCTHPYFSSVFSTNHYYVLYPSILLISILNKSLLCIVPIHITHKYSQQTIIMYCTHPYFSSVFSTNHYYVLYPPIIIFSRKHIMYSQQTQESIIMSLYSQETIIISLYPPYFSSVFSTNHYYVLYPSILSHQYSQQIIIMYCTHPYYSSVFSTNHYYVLYPSILLIIISSILNKPLLCIVPIHITHKYSQQTIIMYCTHPYFIISSILNKSLLCIVPIHITHQYSQQIIIMYCTHPYYSSVFSTNHYYVLYPSILLISILNKPLLCIVPIHITHKYSQQTIIMYCTHPYYLIIILNKALLCIVPIHITHQYSQQTIIMYCTHPYYS